MASSTSFTFTDTWCTPSGSMPQILSPVQASGQAGSPEVACGPMRWNLPTYRVPEAWFNVAPHLPEPLRPPLHPATREPVGPDDLAALFPMALIAQEMTAEPWVDVPGPVLDVLRLWRPTPLVRAERLEKALGTPARIYYKDESVSPAGSHKPNTAVPQAFYNKAEGMTRLATETGLSQLCSRHGLAAV